MNKKNREIMEILELTYPDAKCALNHASPFQLLVATVLSAQTTDKKVNEVTEVLFVKYRNLDDFLTISQEELEAHIRVIGLYKTKAKNLMNLFRMLQEEFGGEVPETMEELTRLPGVGRKTANVVLSNCFDIPAIAVDTHVFRVANRLGIVEENTPEKTELALMTKLDRKIWTKAHHILIFHGRQVCHARGPECGRCPVNHLCRYYKENRNKLIPKGQA